MGHYPGGFWGANPENPQQKETEKEWLQPGNQEKTQAFSEGASHVK